MDFFSKTTEINQNMFESDLNFYIQLKQIVTVLSKIKSLKF